MEANRGGGYVGDCGGGSCDHEDNYKLQLEDEPWTGLICIGGAVKRRAFVNMFLEILIY